MEENLSEIIKYSPMCRVTSGGWRSWLHILLSFVALNNFCLLSSPKPNSAIHLLKLAGYVLRWFSLSLLVSICSMSINDSNPSFLIICPSNFNCRFLMLCISVLNKNWYNVTVQCSFVCFKRFFFRNKLVNFWKATFLIRMHLCISMSDFPPLIKHFPDIKIVVNVWFRYLQFIIDLFDCSFSKYYSLCTFVMYVYSFFLGFFYYIL